MANIRQNLFFAFIYNMAAVQIAAVVLYLVFGSITLPIIAAAAQLGAASIATMKERANSVADLAHGLVNNPSPAWLVGQACG